MKTEVAMAREGEFLREYGKQYFVVAVEALNIGRVKWSMVPIGTNGQKGIEFYMTTEQMLALCKEIDNGEFEKKLAKDTGAYPSAYRYATGEEGALHLNIGGGKVGCRIQMQDAKSSARYMMAVSVQAMATMASKYMLATGITPVVPGSYYDNIVKEFELGRKERAKFRKNVVDVGDPIDMNNDTGAYGSESEQPAEKVEKKETKTVEKKTEKKAEDKKTDTPPESRNFTLLIHGEKTLKKGFWTFAGKDEDGKAISLMFRQDDAKTLGWFEPFANTAAAKETTLTIAGERKGDFILYTGPAKK